MDITTLKSQIQTQRLLDFYIFTGEEWAVQKIYINQIAKVKQLKVSYVDGISDIYSKLKNRGFIDVSYLYVIINDKDIQTQETIQIQLNSGILKNNILIYIWTDVDKRTKFYNKFKERIVEFEPLTDIMLKKYILKEISLSDRNCQRLIDICEHNYGRILLEIDKIKRYAKGFAGDYGFDNFFTMLLQDGTIYQPPYDAIFDFVDAILNRKPSLAFELFNESILAGEATMVMLSVLYKNTKAVLQVQACESNDIAKSTGLSGWEIQNAKKHIGKYRIGELVQMLRLIQKIESGIKKGVMPEEIAMEYILVNIL